MGALGLALGFFIGVLCGLSVLLLIRTATTAKATLKTTTAEISQLLAIPTFCFGGPWLTSAVFTHLDTDGMLPPYACALSLSFALIAGYPLTVLIVATGHHVEKMSAES